MRCSSCGSDNPSGKRFCGDCGAPLTNHCPKCGAENPPGKRFCGDCGTALATTNATAQSTAASASLPDIAIPAEQKASAIANGERKTVTALFADIKGSMELMEDLDPEEARAIVDPALKLMIDAVRRYGGYVVQSTGDGIFALFGAPVAYEDHPQRALYTALRMQDEIHWYSGRLRESGNLPIEARVGVNTGEVVVRSIATGEGHPEYTPIGHSISLAARMQALAPTGSIAATGTTRKLCEGYFTFKSLGPTIVKGVTEPVNVYEVTGLGFLRTKLQRAAAGGLTKFVGREHEMQALQRAAESVQKRHGQLVAAVAEPGVGKSRLFYEFKAISQSGWMVLEAFSVSHDQASAYLPVLEMLSAYFEISRDDDERKRGERILGKVLGLDRALEDTLPYLYSLHGIAEAGDSMAQMDPQIRRRRTLEAIKRLLLREILNLPLIIIFEDLHWIDGETQALLNLLVDAIANARILLMVSYRPEYHHEWGSRTHYTQLRLDPLGHESAAEMLSALLGDEPELESLKRLIVDRTEGNPFFVEETVQALFEQGVLARNGKIDLKQPLATIKIPSTVQALLASRIDRLPTNEKELLQTLSVMGREFTLALIRQVVGSSAAELECMLDNLQSGEFIYEQPAFPNPEYTFKHALTQEVAYNSLLIERRRELHERTAAALEELFAGKLDEQADALAHHYSRSGNAAKAVGFLHRAAEQARTRSAYDDAIGYVNEALRLLAELPESWERDRDEITIQGIRGLLLSATQGFATPDLAQCLNRGLALCQRIGEGPEMFTVMFQLWNMNLVRNRLHDVMKLAEKILGLSRLINTELAEAAAHSAFGSTCLWRGEFSAACQHLEQANAIYDRDIGRFLPMYKARVVPSRAQASWALWMRGYSDQAHARAEEALTFATRLGNPFSMMFALMHTITLTQFRGDYSMIRSRAETMSQIAREQGFPYWSAIASMLIGRVAVGKGDHDAGIIRMRDAMTTLRETGGELVYNYALSLLAESYLTGREPERGLAVVAEAFKRIEISGQRMHEAELWRLRGELLVLRGDAEAEAERNFHCALQVAQGQQARSWELHAAISLARLLLARNRQDEARSILTPILASFTEGFESTDFKEAAALLSALS